MTSLADHADSIYRLATDIATLTVSVRGQDLAAQIARLASDLRTLDLDAEPCGCWVCEGRPADKGVACRKQHARAAHLAPTVRHGAESLGATIGRVLITLATEKLAERTLSPIEVLT